MSENVFLDSVNAVEFYVGSARQWAFFHEKAMGFTPVGYAGPETGVRDRVSYLMKQGKFNLILTSFLDPDSYIAQHIKTHGDGVHDVSLKVPDIELAVKEIEKRGLIKPSKIRETRSEYGILRSSVISTYGDTVHSLVDYSSYDSDLPPGFQEIDGVKMKESGTGLTGIDHIVGNVEENRMDPWVDYYIKGLNFKQFVSFDDKDISTEYSALRSKVVEYNNRSIVFPINEPALGLKKSQIQEYIDYYKSPGVQHIAITTDNIIKTVSDLKKRGVEFLETPSSYYTTLADRVGKIDEDIESLKKHNILVDRDDTGYMLQIFTKPIGDRPTFFYEIIQRKGGTSFGKGNFKALFEAIEREQARRGNL
ncbi:MAG: 4-hydroxyphenylpyruvate dioxygenase [Candidatus Thermoplasmatota archaeon]|nr:4-hydroxyphenylpyruvate dioxygenase [Candidatus Thermoplasmatota archaeon]